MFDFSQHGTVESLSTVPDDFQPFYKEAEDGSFSLDTDNPAVVKAVAVITGLNKSLGAARREAKDSKVKQVDLSALAEYGSTPEEIVEGFAARIGEIQSDAGKKSDSDIHKKIEAIKTDLLKANEKAVGDRDVRIEALTGQLYKQLVESQAVAALADIAVSTELALPFVQKHIQVAEIDGKFQVQVVDDDGIERHGGTGNPMTIAELVTEMKGQERFAPLFKSDSPGPGGGTPPGGPSRRPIQPVKEMNPSEKIASGLRKGQHQNSGASGRRM